MISLSRNIVLVCNPRCASQSIQEALQLIPAPYPGTPWLTGFRLREELNPSFWNQAMRLVVVRNPVDRFLSACHAIKDTQEATKIEELGFDAFIYWLHDRVTKRGTHPTFRRQLEWLAFDFTHAVALHNLAEFFNHHNFPTIHTPRKERRVGIPARESELTGVQRRAICRVYRDDFTRFDNLRVWHPRGRVRTIYGDCPTCDRRIAAARKPLL